MHISMYVFEEREREIAIILNLYVKAVIYISLSLSLFLFQQQTKLILISLLLLSIYWFCFNLSKLKFSILHIIKPGVVPTFLNASSTIFNILNYKIYILIINNLQPKKLRIFLLILYIQKYNEKYNYFYVYHVIN